MFYVWDSIKQAWKRHEVQLICCCSGTPNRPVGVVLCTLGGWEGNTWGGSTHRIPMGRRLCCPESTAVHVLQDGVRTSRHATHFVLISIHTGGADCAAQEPGHAAAGG